MPYIISVLGINQLLVMEYSMFLGIVLLMPIYFSLFRQKAKKSAIDWLVFSFFLLSTWLDFRDSTAASQSIKEAMTNFLAIWMPYWVIANYKGSINRCLIALLLIGVAMAFHTVFEWARTWRLYLAIAQNIDGVIINSLQRAYYFRGWGLRSSASWFAPIPMGVFMASICFLVFYMDRLGLKKNWVTWGMLTVSFAALLFTDSRGALLALIVIFYTGFYFKNPGRVWKLNFKIITFTGIIIVILNLNTLYAIDTSGTFQYRADLISYSMDAFERAPWFGDPLYRENRVLVENMTQGQGIVDIVNHYLHVVLAYGSVGLGLYLLIWFMILAKVGIRASTLQMQGFQQYTAGMFLVSILAGIALAIYTVSLTGFFSEYVYILFALSSAYLKNTDSLLLKKTY